MLIAYILQCLTAAVVSLLSLYLLRKFYPQFPPQREYTILLIVIVVLVSAGCAGKRLPKATRAQAEEICLTLANSQPGGHGNKLFNYAVCMIDHGHKRAVQNPNRCGISGLACSYPSTIPFNR